MPIPYMGSKQKSAGKIYQAIKNQNPESKVLVDLFCGGFAISEYFYRNGWNIVANDKNKYVVALADQVINKGLDEKKCLEFVTRETFFKVLKNPEKYDDWYVGFVSCIWSFGNSQKGYLFGKDVEKYKKAGHELVVNCNSDLIVKLVSDFPKKYIDGITKQENWHLRRIALRKVTKILATRIFELEQLERLERLERLEQLERLERLERLELTSCDYRDVMIPECAVIYCDPPYQGTTEYAEGSFNHTEFWQWVREKSITYKVYVSEYTAPDDFVSILEFEQKSTLQGGQQKHNNQPKEKLFVYANKKDKLD